MKTFLIFSAALLIGLQSATAADPHFSVTIVGCWQGQEHSFRDPQATKDSGFPVVHLPLHPPSNPHMEPDQASAQGTHFYVVVRNDSKKAIRIDQAASDWFNCLDFSITTPDGKTFDVHRPYAQSWTWNPMESWIFSPGGMRIFPVDFTTGKWDGLPGYDSVRSQLHFMLNAHFLYGGPRSKKHLDFHSGLTEVRNG